MYCGYLPGVSADRLPMECSRGAGRSSFTSFLLFKGGTRGYLENVLIVSAKTHERSKAGETIPGLFIGFAHLPQPTRLPSAKKPLQARLGNLFARPLGNGFFGTPVYTMVYIFVGEAIFSGTKKAGTSLLTYRLCCLSGGEGGI